MSYYQINKIKNRIMADKSISKSFKGILRIAHILDSPSADNNDDLNKLSELFYRNFRAASDRKLIDIDGKTTKDNAIGYPKAYPYGLDESNPISRYKSDDPFINAKLPICDSLGNYININAGLNGVVFGSDETIGKATTELICIDSSSSTSNISNYQPKYFPVLTGQHLVVGMEGIKIASEKKPNNKNAIVSLNDGKTDAKIVIDHLNTEEDIKTRTIYSLNDGTYGRNYGLIVSQENWERDSFEALTPIENNTDYELNKTVALKTDLTDLVGYVNERINKYINSNSVQVPAGSVIWEYVSLWNYYAKNDTGFITNNTDEFAGHRPKLANPISSTTSINSSDYPFKNTLFGTNKNNSLILKTNKLLGRNPNDGNSSFEEIIPLYKRDYVLCDGKKYYISPSKDAANSNQNAEFDRLINLFLAIGYHYSDLKENDILLCVKYNNSYRYIVKVSDEYKVVNTDSIREITKYAANGLLLKKKGSELEKFKSNYSIQDLLWSNDITSLLAYHILSELETDVYRGGRDNVINTLKTKEIPNEYAYYGVTDFTNNFNSDYFTYVIPSTSDYGDTLKSINFKIGKEIINFESTIAIPIISENCYSIKADGTVVFNRSIDELELKIIEDCNLFKHPAVQAFTDLIINNDGKNATNRWIASAATFGFKVPNFNMNYKANIIGENNSILSATKYSNTGNNGIGGFMGTCAFTWVNSGHEYDPAEQFDYTCNATETNIPHRHHVFNGYAYNTDPDAKQKVIIDYMGYKSSVGPSYVAECKDNNEPCYYYLSNPNVKGAINSTAYLDNNTYSYMINMYPVDVENNITNTDRFFSRILKQNSNYSNDNIITLDGIMEPNRCITSGPSWISNSNPAVDYNMSQSEEDGGFIDFFSPECLYMVPLIKL